ncbi:hypothetical protein SMACR_08515 [Sordaria macrospora]|uniref:WGS project CABT00000000 data, contig 2.54 n=2 Tax=Sordaria macrospora TaxID=5147 RepID=F7W9S5_SORMK|nr:uncharacterized protein SMAC_08515 [Sordaria macrospora k-hell]KAA8632162.1 hypothetical protein SMACR_08515 [Sordaria macrospora]WPJ57172.1 hypothetical protein SMAC4_08515 [Sordaria macrospora]CCC14066.1 unnamed protein product [Sordaria macrospora k-hell]
MKFLSLFTLTALSCSTALAKSHFVLNDRDFTLPDRHLLRALARRQHSNGTSISELRALSLDASHQFLNTRQTTGRCGANYGRCGDNLCCSDYGYCGDSVDHCYPGFDCQPAYGPMQAGVPAALNSSGAVPDPNTAHHLFYHQQHQDHDDQYYVNNQYPDLNDHVCKTNLHATAWSSVE